MGMMKLMSVSDRMEHVRQDKGLDKAAFSAALDLDPQTYYRILRDRAARPNMDLVLGIVTHFNVNPSWLLFGTGAMYITQKGSGEVATATKAPAPGMSARELRADARERNRAGLSESDWIRLNVLREIGSLQSELHMLVESCNHISRRIGRAIEFLDATIPEGHAMGASE